MVVDAKPTNGEVMFRCAVDAVSARERLADELARMHERQLPEAVEAEAVGVEDETIEAEVVP